MTIDDIKSRDIHYEDYPELSEEGEIQMSYIEVIRSRLSRLRKALDTAKERDQFDVCLRLEGQILAYESVYADLLNVSSSEIEAGVDFIMDTDFGGE